MFFERPKFLLNMILIEQKGCFEYNATMSILEVG